MPRMDGTGPMGRGPGTGWGQGPCMRGAAGPRARFGAGCRFRPYTKEDELAALEQESRMLEEDLKAVKDRLDELKS